MPQEVEASLPLPRQEVAEGLQFSSPNSVWVIGGFDPQRRSSTTVQFLITQNLRRWLADQVDILGVTASAPAGEENTMQIDITYRERATRIRRQLRVSVP